MPLLAGAGGQPQGCVGVSTPHRPLPPPLTWGQDAAGEAEGEQRASSRLHPATLSPGGHGGAKLPASTGVTSGLGQGGGAQPPQGLAVGDEVPPHRVVRSFCPPGAAGGFVGWKRLPRGTSVLEGGGEGGVTPTVHNLAQNKPAKEMLPHLHPRRSQAGGPGAPQGHGSRRTLG